MTSTIPKMTMPILPGERESLESSVVEVAAMTNLCELYGI
jgi:hypothetical protein